MADEPYQPPVYAAESFLAGAAISGAAVAADVGLGASARGSVGRELIRHVLLQLMQALPQGQPFLHRGCASIGDAPQPGTPAATGEPMSNTEASVRRAILRN